MCAAGCAQQCTSAPGFLVRVCAQGRLTRTVKDSNEVVGFRWVRVQQAALFCLHDRCRSL
eukprot:12549612-Alexandrium_andersonii.AAC.1